MGRPSVAALSCLDGSQLSEWILGLGTKNGNGFRWLAGGAFPVSDWQLPAWRVEFIPIESLGKKSVDFTIGTDRAEKDATACDPAEFLETVLNFQSGEINSDLNRLVGTVERRIVTSYRYEASSRLPAKLTVSELKRREQTLAPEESPRGIGLILDQWPDQEASQPIEKTGLTPVEQGILLHNFFRYVDLPALCAVRDQGDRPATDRDAGQGYFFRSGTVGAARF